MLHYIRLQVSLNDNVLAATMDRCLQGLSNWKTTMEVNTEVDETVHLPAVHLNLFGAGLIRGLGVQTVLWIKYSFHAAKFTANAARFVSWGHFRGCNTCRCFQFYRDNWYPRMMQLTPKLPEHAAGKKRSIALVRTLQGFVSTTDISLYYWQQRGNTAIRGKMQTCDGCVQLEEELEAGTITDFSEHISSEH
jgi:hypothetical protein